MEVLEDGPLLNFGLAIIIDSGCERRLKRKRRESFKSLDTNGVSEGKMFNLLETRELMLQKGNKRREATTSEDGKGLHLIHLLLVCATSFAENKLDSTIKNLKELYENVSLYGDSVQRMAAYFADGLVARLLTRRSPFHEMIMKEPTAEEGFLAYTELYKVSPYYQFAHFTANQMIMEAFEREETYNNRTLHVVDLDVAYGFQWPSLMQSLSETGNHVSLRITGFGKTVEELEETEARLVGFAKTFRNLSFEFQGMLRSNCGVKSIRKRENETIAVNLVFYLNSLGNFKSISDLLKSVYMLNPSVIVLIEQEGSRSPRTFLSRFIEFLHYYAAMFDSLDDFLPLDSLQRLQIEKNHLGKEIKRLMEFDNDEGSSPHFERMETWKGRMEGHGFEGTSLSSKSIIQAKLLLKINSHSSPIQLGGENEGFTAFEREEGNAISLAWQDKCLITASAWQCTRGR
ncbi:putative transcription factor GRAS family [Helianthus annuus]|nr:putative transcription factor GRAS family [Helianthus annuus]KAJ0746762.1 putative transcription factor GRAS family [Helianthus annuus]